MGKLMADLHKMHQHRGRVAGGGFLGSTKLLGDIANIPDSALSQSGVDIKAILSGGGQPLGNTVPQYNAPGPLGSAACSADACCVYKYAMLDMTALFSHPSESGGCSALARGAIRLGFHDAAAWSTDAGYGGGGADGSILLSPTEFARPANAGLESIGNQTIQWYNRYRQYGATMADLIQLGAMTAVVTCPGGPRMRFYVGRVDNSNAALDGLLPQPTDSAESIAALFAAKTFSAGGLAALVGAHTVSQQFTTAPQFAGASQDTTPGVWDNNYYNTTTAAASGTPPPPGVYRFASDVALAQHGDTAASFQFFGSAAGRSVWQTAFAAEYLRLSLLGVYNLNDATTQARQFRQKIGNYNCVFSFASIKCNETNRGAGAGGPTCFQIQGTLYHRTGPLEAQQDKNKAAEHRCAHTSTLNGLKLDDTILLELSEYMKQNNELAKSYNHAHERLLQSGANTVIISPQMEIVDDPREDHRRNNLPRTVLSHRAVGPTHGFKYVNVNHAAYFPLSYPMMFPTGQLGFHWNMLDNNGRRVTLARWVRYQLYMRSANSLAPFFYGRPLQQFLVDVRAANDQECIAWYAYMHAELVVVAEGVGSVRIG